MARGRKLLVAAILIALVVGGLLYFGILGPEQPPAAGALFDATWEVDSDIDRTSTETLSADEKRIEYLLSDSGMDGLGDFDGVATIINRNTARAGEVDVASARVSVASVGTVFFEGQDRPIANQTAQGAWDITYTDDAAPGDWQQSADVFTTSNFPYGGRGQLSLDINLQPSVLDDHPAGNTVEISFSLAGAILVVAFTET